MGLLFETSILKSLSVFVNVCSDTQNHQPLHRPLPSVLQSLHESFPLTTDKSSCFDAPWLTGYTYTV